MHKATIIMTKVPRAGHVKTRLQPFLDDRQCEELACAFLGDAETKVLSETKNSMIAFTPSEYKNELESILHGSHLLVEQRGCDLGERMSNAFEHAFASGFDQVVMTGTDSPTFPVSSLSTAFDFLENGSDAVLGKTQDGGFYLIGLKKPERRIFENVEWSTDLTGAQTIGNIERLGLKISFVADWKDVDRKDDLIALNSEIHSNPGIAPATFNWLCANSDLFDSPEE